MTVECYIPNPIDRNSWLMAPEFEWFRKGHLYATTQISAIPAVSKCTPEELYFAVISVMRGADIKTPE